MVESGPQGWTRFCCQTCPYVHPMEPSDKITRKVPKTVISPHAACGHDCRVDQPAKQTGCSRLSHRVPYLVSHAVDVMNKTTVLIVFTNSALCCFGPRKPDHERLSAHVNTSRLQWVGLRRSVVSTGFAWRPFNTPVSALFFLKNARLFVCLLVCFGVVRLLLGGTAASCSHSV